MSSREQQILSLIRDDPMLPQQAIAAQLGISRSAVAGHIMNLGNKGLIKGRAGEPTEQRGGRPKRYFDLTPLGVGRLRDSARALFGVWDGIEGLLDGDAEA